MSHEARADALKATMKDRDGKLAAANQRADTAGAKLAAANQKVDTAETQLARTDVAAIRAASFAYRFGGPAEVTPHLDAVQRAGEPPGLSQLAILRRHGMADLLNGKGRVHGLPFLLVLGHHGPEEASGGRSHGEIAQSVVRD